MSPEEKQLVLAEKTALTKSAPIVRAAQALQVVDQQSYLKADILLSQISASVKVVKGEVKESVDKGKEAVSAARSALKAVTDLVDRMLHPFEEAESVVKRKMTEFKVKERNQIEQARREQQQKTDRLRRESEELERKSQQAKTAATRQKLEDQAHEKQQQAAVMEVQPQQQEIKGSASSVRVMQKIRVKDKLAAMAAVMAGDAPDELFEIDTVFLNAWFKMDPQIAAACPGLEVYEDLVIAKRS